MNPLSGNNNNNDDDDKTPQPPPTTSSSSSLLSPWQQQPQKPQSRVQPPLTAATVAAIESAFSAALGCCVSHLIIRPNNLHQTLQEECEFIWNKFQSYLQTPEFVEFCLMEGIMNPSITLCHKSLNSLWDAFQTQVEKDVVAGGTSTLQLGVVFHGTAKSNIPSILQSGLDPKRRIGQAYGVGEYFSKNPSTSLSYCKGDNQMLVYCVVIPTASTLTLSSSSSSSSSSKTVFASQRYYIQNNNKPQDIVVVEKSQHQVPIAVLEFSGASATAIQRSASIRYQLQQLHKQVQQAEAATNEIKVKAQIIQLLFANELQGAAHKFRTACANAALFSDIAKLEISYWAHKHADAEVVQFYFNHSFENEDYNNNASESSSSLSLSLLPPPPPNGWNTFQNDIVSVEAQQAKLQQAWNNVKECQDKLKAEMDKNINNSNNSSISTTNASSTTMSTTLQNKLIAGASRPSSSSTFSVYAPSTTTTTTTSCSRKRPEEETSNDDDNEVADGRVVPVAKKSTSATSSRTTTTTSSTSSSTSWSSMFRDDDVSMVASSSSSLKSPSDAKMKSETDVAVVETNQEDGSNNNPST